MQVLGKFGLHEEYLVFVRVVYFPSKPVQIHATADFFVLHKIFTWKKLAPLQAH